MSPIDESSPITLDDCAAYIDNQVFRLQPSFYGRNYPDWPGLVGLEVEVCVLLKNRERNGVPVLAPLYRPNPSIADYLLKLSIDHPGWVGERQDPDDDSEEALARVLLDEGDQLTFEPGGQLEFSSIPYPCLGDALERLRSVQSVLDASAAKSGFEFAQLGINPWHTVDQIGLQMRKPRYRAMDRHFATIGEFGQRMMRQTCTIQVNLDFGPDESVLAKRYLAAQLIAPFATAIFANSPYVDGKKTPYKSFRSRVWQQADPSRTGFPSRLAEVSRTLSKQSVCDSYLESVLNAQIIFVEGADYAAPEKKVTFADWLNEPLFGLRPTLADFKTHLSLHFPEVRARGFLELRSVDGQARAWQSIPPAFYTGLFYDPKTLDQALDLLLPMLPDLNALWLESSYGLRDQGFRQTAQRVSELAMSGFARLPTCYRENCASEHFATFNEHFTAKGRSPASDLIQFVEKEGAVSPTPMVLEKLNAYWQRLLF